MSNNISFSFLPQSYVSSVKERIDVKNLTEDKTQGLREKIGNLSTFEQEVLLQDLLVAGRKNETSTEKQYTILAAELFLKTHNEAQRDFLLHVNSVGSIFKNFSDAVIANNYYHHEKEKREKGASGLNENELRQEAELAKKFETHLRGKK